MDAIFETSIDVGFRVLGPVMSAIRREARLLDVALEPFPFAKMSPINSVPIKATGAVHNLCLFEEFIAELRNRYAN
jgi:hypothetical protein